VRTEDPRADEVAGHEVGRELDAAERPAENPRRGLDRQRLGEAGHALDQQVPVGQQAHEDALDERVLSRDHALDLVEGLFDLILPRACLGARL
jgi:hypothetical protein